MELEALNSGLGWRMLLFREEEQKSGLGVGGEKNSSNVELYVICLYQREVSNSDASGPREARALHNLQSG